MFKQSYRGDEMRHNQKKWTCLLFEDLLYILYAIHLKKSDIIHTIYL